VALGVAWVARTRLYEERCVCGRRRELGGGFQQLLYFYPEMWEMIQVTRIWQTHQPVKFLLEEFFFSFKRFQSGYLANTTIGEELFVPKKHWGNHAHEFRISQQPKHLKHTNVMVQNKQKYCSCTSEGFLSLPFSG